MKSTHARMTFKEKCYQVLEHQWRETFVVVPRPQTFFLGSLKETRFILHNLPFTDFPACPIALIGDRSGRISPLISIPEDSSTPDEQSMGLRLCLDKYLLLADVGVSCTVGKGFIGDMFGLDMVLAVECLCLTACLGVDWSDTGLEVT